MRFHFTEEAPDPRLAARLEYIQRSWSSLKKPMGLDKGKIIAIVQLGFSLLAFILSIVALAGGVADNADDD